MDKSISVVINGKPLYTPAKRPVAVPTQALADAIAAEWQNKPTLKAGEKRSLTIMVNTAIDQVEGHKENMVESLLAYVDTDALTYHASGSDALRKQQEESWNRVLQWVGRRMDVAWEVTTGVMPIEQPESVHNALRRYLSVLTPLELTACAMFASCCSSLVLAIAIMENHLPADDAYRLSRLEEEYQAQQWGKDEETESRAERIKEEILLAKRLLDLLRAREDV